MENDPFIDKRKEYNKLLSNYNKIIVSSFNKKDFEKYNEILFSCHSCGIEGNSFSVDETRELKEKGFAIDLKGKSMLEAFEISDHFNAYSYIMENKNTSFNEEFLKKTHYILMKNTISYKGYKPGEYSKKQMAAGDTIFRDTKKAIQNMPKLLESFDKEIKLKRMNPVEISAIFHKMFIYSHPFPDGNGRLARLMSNFIMEKFNHPHIIILKEEREKYIDSLKASETHNSMKPIITFFYETSITRMNKEISQKKNLSKNFNIGISNKNNGISF